MQTCLGPGREREAPRARPSGRSTSGAASTAAEGQSWHLGAALALVLAAACARPGEEPRHVAPPKRNVILLTLDTTRADHLGLYGHAAASTPILDRLGREGVVFDDAITVAPLTLPSHTSIMTGLFPPRHGVRDNGTFYLDDRFTTLAEQLHDAGYRTAAFVAAAVLEKKYGLGQGFEVYDEDFSRGGTRRE